jgi:hypothetical protein
MKENSSLIKSGISMVEFNKLMEHFGIPRLRIRLSSLKRYRVALDEKCAVV